MLQYSLCCVLIMQICKRENNVEEKMHLFKHFHNYNETVEQWVVYKLKYTQILILSYRLFYHSWETHGNKIISLQVQLVSENYLIKNANKIGPNWSKTQISFILPLMGAE